MTCCIMATFQKCMWTIIIIWVTFALSNNAVAAGYFTTDDVPNPPMEEYNFPKGGTETRGFVSATFGTNMVLQRDQDIPIWGYAKVPGTTITTKVVVLSKDDSNDESTILLEGLQATAGEDGFWRQILPPQSASLNPVSIMIVSSGDDQAVELSNILFGDVYICGGQSNMQFDLSRTTNSTQEIAAADKYSHIRIFTVGTGTKSDRPLQDLQTIEQTWSVASSKTVAPPADVAPPPVEPKGFQYFSSVCWFFGTTIADALDNKVPLGLVSNNYGGTKVELWSSSEAFEKCGRKEAQGVLYNAMIHPYTVGPMALTGFTWYQGEANAKGGDSAELYSCLFPAMIESWRKDFKPSSPNDLYFGFIQLATRCETGKHIGAIAELRNAQMSAYEKLQHIGYATNADHGAGCNVHPPTKQPCAKRLGRSALALQYGEDDLVWRSPSYSSASASIRTLSNGKAIAHVMIDLEDVGDDGLYTINPFNYMDGTFECTKQTNCAWAALQLSRDGWVNATVKVTGKSMILSANIASISLSSPFSALRQQTQHVIGTSYGWGAVPMLSVYRNGTDLPVLPWNKTLVEHGSVVDKA